MRPQAAHPGVLQRGQAVPGQAMYPMQQAYPSGMAVPQYGYLPQHAMYQQPPGAYLGNGSAYAPARGYHNQQQQQQQHPPPPQTQPDYNCQVSPCPARHALMAVSAPCMSAPTCTSSSSLFLPCAAALQAQAAVSHQMICRGKKECNSGRTRAVLQGLMLSVQACGTTALDLDSYRQHVRAKQHMKRVQSRHSAHV